LSFAEIFGIRKLESLGCMAYVVCVILRSAVSEEHRLVTDGQTDIRRQVIPALASISRVKITWCQVWAVGWMVHLQKLEFQDDSLVSLTCEPTHCHAAKSHRKLIIRYVSARLLLPKSLNCV